MKQRKPACRHDTSSHGVSRPGAWEAATVERAAQLCRALGDGPRLQVLLMLTRGELCVTEIVSATGEKFSTVSQRMRLLRSEGLVARRRDGTHIYYTLADRHVADLVENALAHARELRAGPAHDGDPQEGD